MSNINGFFCGIQHGKGTSKIGQAYEFAIIRLLVKDEGFQSSKAVFRATGYKITDFPLDLASYDKLSMLPVNGEALKSCELVTTTRVNQWQKIEAVVVDVKFIK